MVVVVVVVVTVAVGARAQDYCQWSQQSRRAVLRIVHRQQLPAAKLARTYRFDTLSFLFFLCACVLERGSSDDSESEFDSSSDDVSL